VCDVHSHETSLSFVWMQWIELCKAAKYFHCLACSYRLVFRCSGFQLSRTHVKLCHPNSFPQSFRNHNLYPNPNSILDPKPNPLRDRWSSVQVGLDQSCRGTGWNGCNLTGTCYCLPCCTFRFELILTVLVFPLFLLQSTSAMRMVRLL